MYSYFDAHCDTMSKIHKFGIGLDSDALMVNVNHLSKYKSAVQVFALFNKGDMCEEEMFSAFRNFKAEAKRLSGSLSICTTACDITKNTSPLSAILAIEGLGNQPDFSIDAVTRFWEEGVRFMGLCWNHDNSLCGGCEGDGRGLSELGEKTLRTMEEKRIILDVSHMSDKSFWESAEVYSLPFCATHSSSRAVFGHHRNITDAQFLGIASRGGVCGINFYPPFLGAGKADISTVIKHIEHFMALGGEDSIGLGSDFDGIDAVPHGIENAGDFYKLFDALLMLNYKEEAVEKIAFGNFLRFFRSLGDGRETCKEF